MPGYLVEVYASRLHRDTPGEASVRLRQATEVLARAGTQVAYVRSVFLPEDEMCFHFFEAASLDVIKESCRRLGLAGGRITMATENAHKTSQVVDVNDQGTPRTANLFPNRFDNGSGICAQGMSGQREGSGNSPRDQARRGESD